MARPPDPQKKTELLERCFVAAQAGSSLELSLADLAEGAGTSARMLIYHFGSREGLEHALVERVEEELRQRFRAFESATPGQGPRAAVLAIWDALTHPSMHGLLRMVMEVLHRARRGDAAARERAVAQTALWEEFLAPCLADRSASTALFLLVQGAVLDFLVLGDADRGRRALAAFLAADSAGAG
jgi:AcrR family transcriptional regulator